MDALDRKILNLIQTGAAASGDELASRVPLSASAITRRLRRMRDEGIISHEAAVLSPAIRERQVTAVMHVQLDRHTPSEWAKLKRYFADMPEVQICLEITGSSDLLMMVSARDMSQFNEIADRIGEHPLVRRYESSFVKRFVKMSLAIQLDEED